MSGSALTAAERARIREIVAAWPEPDEVTLARLRAMAAPAIRIIRNHETAASTKEQTAPATGITAATGATIIDATKRDDHATTSQNQNPTGGRYDQP